MERSCVITGATRGIGRAIERTLKGDNYRVLSVQRTGPGVYADLVDFMSVPALWASIMRDLPSAPDVVILNAGRCVESPLLSTHVSEFLEVLHLNLVTPLLIAREAIRTWRTHKKKGHLVFVGSQAGLPGVKHSDNVFYTASKAAIHSIVGPLSSEFGPLIRVNAVAPGNVTTMTELRHVRRAAKRKNETFRHRFTEIGRRSPLERWVSPNDVASAVLFLDRCEAMNGAIVNVSCGETVH